MKNIDVSRNLFAFPAAVMRGLESFDQKLGERAISPGRLIALAKERALDAEAFMGEPYIWPALITNNRVDSYYTRMAKTSLTNYAANVNEGRSFQNSHNTDELSLGRSLWGEITTEPNGLELGAEFGGGTDELIEVVAAFYTAPNLRLTNINTDDFIRGIKLALVNDVSIGFYNADYVCSICALDLFDWDCPHIPGMAYNITDGAGKKIGERLAFAWIENALLAEVSAVFKGATPGAAILKAQIEAEAGRIQDVQRKTIESRYRMALPVKSVMITGAGLQKERTAMAGETTNPAPPAQGSPGQGQQPGAGANTTGTDAPGAGQQGGGEQGQENRQAPPVTAPLTTAAQPGTDEGSRFVASLRQLLDAAETAEPEVLKGLRSLVTTEGLRSLVDLAADGKRFRAALVKAAREAGVRAMGAERFTAAEAAYGPILDNPATPVETIRRFIADWGGKGDDIFMGGRQTEDEAEVADTVAIDNAPLVAYT